MFLVSPGSKPSRTKIGLSKILSALRKISYSPVPGYDVVSPYADKSTEVVLVKVLTTRPNPAK